MKPQHLKLARFKKNLSQWEVAARSGVSRYRIGLFETGKLKELRPEEISSIKRVMGEAPISAPGREITDV